jgi:adenosylcobinamide-GDP ribazoletransferase
MFTALTTAFRTLTVLPLPGQDTDNFSNSLLFFPVVGACIGFISYVAAYYCNAAFHDSYLLSALLITLLSTVLTGALHLDGLADAADGFGGGRTKERILEIMKDSRHGTFGVTALVFDICARILLISLYLENKQLLFIACAPFFSRTYQALGCSLFSYARTEKGNTALFISSKFYPVVIAIFLLQTGSILYVTRSVPMGLMIFGSFLTTLLFFIYCRIRIGGITGDCVGTGNELAEISFLLIGMICCNL